jgi:lysophospholipase L1-like esterase
MKLIRQNDSSFFMRFTHLFRAIFIFSAAFIFSTAIAAEKPDLMLTVGDSISAGYVASSHLDDGSNIGPGSSDMQFHPVAGIPFWFQMGQVLNEKATYSWSSGELIDSHYERLKADLLKTDPQSSLVVQNVAVTGGGGAQLSTELAQVLGFWNSGDYASVKYVTFLIGANDLCGKITPDATFANYLRHFFRGLATIKQKEPIRVLVSSMPRIPDVAQPAIAQEHTFLGMTCQEVIKMTHYCDPLALWKTPEEYATAMKLVEDKNQVIADVVAEMNRELPQLQMVYSDVFFQQPIVGPKLAADCFHPNQEGQANIARLLWAEQPWYQ